MNAEDTPEWMLGLEEPPDDDMPPEPLGLRIAPPAPDAPDAPRAPDRKGGTGSSGAPGGDAQRMGNAALLAVRDWLGRFILTMTPNDLDLLALWTVHTHLVAECYTSPRLQLDSPMPGSGKTTVLDHLARLCVWPVQMSAVSSSALLGRMFTKGMRTVLIDEVDRTLDPKQPGAPDIIAILNSGYRVGASRPVLTQVGKDWDMVEMPCFGPVAMAGNAPNLPDDTRSRVLRVVLLPDLEGRIEDSDWELIEGDAKALHDQIAAWAKVASDQVRTARPELPQGIIGRNREKFGPLARIASVAGGGWPAIVDELALLHLREQEMDREDGLTREAPAVLLLKHIAELWPQGDAFVSTADILEDLIREYPDNWGLSSPFGKALTAKRLGRMLSQAFKVHSVRLERPTRRGYTMASLVPSLRRMGVPLNESGAPGASGASGAGEQDLFNTTATCGCPNGHHAIHRPGCAAA